MFDQWWLDLWATMAIACAAFALLFAVIGMLIVAFEGRKGWPMELTYVIVMFLATGILFPLVVLIPFVAIYRAVTDK